MFSSRRRPTGSNASDGAPWLGGPAPNQGARRSGNVPRKLGVPNTTSRPAVRPRPWGTFGDATTAGFYDLFQDDLGWLSWLLKFALTAFAAAAIVKHFTPECIEPCPPAPSPLEANGAMTTNFDSTSALQPTSVVSQAHHNIISAVKDYGIQAADYGAKVANHGVKHGIGHGAKYGASIAAAAAPGLWNNFWSGSNSGQNEHKFDLLRTRAWDLVIKKGENMTTFTSLLSDLEGLSGTLYREIADQYTKVSPAKFPSRRLVLDNIVHLQMEQSIIMAKLDEYGAIRKRAADALYVHRHPDSDEKQLEASVNDLKTLRTVLMEVGSDLFTYFHVAEKSIDGLLGVAEDLPWQKEKDKWFGAYKYRSMVAAVGRLTQFDACIKTIRGMITSDIHILR